ncbi:hypothetical protein GA0061098_1011176 [Bradyrhizobium shewense]|uniref:Uncharacterized protein n=1 Tax=Bradyrhizobium shewense TaxID=1761772 RepID=A0A1C3X1X4_9BRAD|nr:hypothetical protein GA0061098_1011176 [Bradyrhizobium shewense]
MCQFAGEALQFYKKAYFTRSPGDAIRSAATHAGTPGRTIGRCASHEIQRREIDCGRLVPRPPVTAGTVLP